MFTCNFLPEPLKFDVQSALVAQHGCSKQVGCIRPAFKWQMTQMFLIYVSHSGIYSFNRSRRGGCTEFFFLCLCVLYLSLSFFPAFVSFCLVILCLFFSIVLALTTFLPLPPHAVFLFLPSGIVH